MRPRLLQLTAVGAVLAVLCFLPASAETDPLLDLIGDGLSPSLALYNLTHPESQAPLDEGTIDQPLAASANPYDSKWDDRFGVSGVAYNLSAVTVFNGDLIVGGERLCIDGQAFNNIARFDGASWQPMGAGLSGKVASLLVGSSALYAAGSFGVARWDGGTWTYMPVGGVSGGYSLCEFEGSIILGTDQGVYRYIGPGWVRMGSYNGSPAGIQAFAIYDGQLFAGGSTMEIDGSPVQGVARWTGSTWVSVGPGIHGKVNDLAVHNGVLVAAGLFDSAGTVAAGNIASWNGYWWDTYQFGGGTNDAILSLCSTDNGLYVGGYFTTAGSTSACHAAKWNDTLWVPLADGLWGTATAATYASIAGIAEYDGALVFGGRFWGSPGRLISGLAQWSHAAWEPVGTAVSGMGLYGHVEALEVYNGNVIAGGYISGSGEQTFSGLVQWDGSSWSELGGGVSGQVMALGTWNDYLVVGGNFSAVGGIPAKNIALWDGLNWTPLATDMTSGGAGLSLIEAIEVFDDKLVIGGYFTSVDGLPIHYLAAWDGSSWSPVGNGLDNSTSDFGAVHTITTYQGQLVIGGWFYSGTGNGLKCLARLEGSIWVELADMFNGEIFSLASVNNELIVAGNYSMINGASIDRLARFDGSTWIGMPAPMGTNPDGFHVETMMVYDGELVIAGWQQIGGGPLIGRWDGATWRTFGTGVTSGWEVIALAQSDGNLYVGGSIVAVGGKGSSSFAVWHGENGCCVMRGDIDESGQIGVSDLTYLVNHLFRGGPAAMCIEHADLDGAGVINASDVVLLVGYLFKGGVGPSACSGR